MTGVSLCHCGSIPLYRQEVLHLATVTTHTNTALAYATSNKAEHTEIKLTGSYDVAIILLSAKLGQMIHHLGNMCTCCAVSWRRESQLSSYCQHTTSGRRWIRPECQPNIATRTTDTDRELSLLSESASAFSSWQLSNISQDNLSLFWRRCSETMLPHRNNRKEKTYLLTAQSLYC